MLISTSSRGGSGGSSRVAGLGFRLISDELPASSRSSRPDRDTSPSPGPASCRRPGNIRHASRRWRVEAVFEPRAVDVGLDEADHVGCGGLHAIGLRIQHARRHPDGLVALECRKRSCPSAPAGPGYRCASARAPGRTLLHQLVEGSPHAPGGEMAEQADARVRVQPLGAGGVGRPPAAKVGDHRVRIGDSFGNCNGSPPAV